MHPVRRITAALRAARWGEIALELTLLVSGILIALAIDNWMDDRKAARSEHQYLQLLAGDLEQDLATLDETIRFEQAQVDAGTLAYRALRRGIDTGQREAIASALNQLTARRTLRLRRATYTDLLSTGNLRLIQNAALRDQIIRLYENNERVQAIRDRNNQEFVDRMYMTYLLDHDFVAPRSVRDLPAVAESDRRFADKVGVPVSVDDDGLWVLPANDPAWRVLAGRVWYRSLVSASAIEQSRTMAAEIRSVRASIAEEVSGRRWP